MLSPKLEINAGKWSETKILPGPEINARLGGECIDFNRVHSSAGLGALIFVSFEALVHRFSFPPRSGCIDFRFPKGRVHRFSFPQGLGASIFVSPRAGCIDFWHPPRPCPACGWWGLASGENS